jgi:rhamnose transport system permease protein
LTSSDIRTRLAGLAKWESILAITTILVFLWAWQTTANFMTAFNLSQAAAGMAERALIVLPMALLIIAREIDVSVASILALSSVVLGVSVRAEHPLALSIALALMVGTACGWLNGTLVTRLRLPALVVTLGTIALYRGLGYVILGNASVNLLPAALNDFGLDMVGGTNIPWTIVPFLVVAPIFFIVAHHTAIGRRIYAIGGSPDVARYTGVLVDRYRVWLFTITGLMCAIAGIVFTARTANARANNALGMELDIITVVFLGGVSMTGGRGRLSGVIWALVLVGLLRNVMTLNQINGNDQGTVIGLLLIGSLLLTNGADRLLTWNRRRRFIAADHR